MQINSVLFSNRQHFFVTLVSNPIPNSGFNTSSSFTNCLCSPIPLGSETFEVGLSEIWFTDTFSIPDTPSTPPVPTPSSPPKTFFGHEANDDRITVNTQLFSLFSVTRDQATHVSSFITHINNQLRSKNAPIVIHNYSTGQVQRYFTILDFTGEGERYLELSPKAAKILGFTKRYFQKGRHTSEETQSEVEFQTLKASEDLTFSVHHSEKKSIPIEDPTAYDFNSLIVSISESFENNNIAVRLVPTKNNESLHVFIDDSIVQFQLPSQINKLLKLERGYTFTQPRTDVYLPTDLPHFKIATPIESPQPIGRRNQLYIITNIIEEQSLGSDSLPLLRVISRPLAQNTERHIQFSPVYFLPLKCTELCYIKIQIVDEDF